MSRKHSGVSHLTRRAFCNAAVDHCTASSWGGRPDVKQARGLNLGRERFYDNIRMLTAFLSHMPGQIYSNATQNSRRQPTWMKAAASWRERKTERSRGARDDEGWSLWRTCANAPPAGYPFGGKVPFALSDKYRVMLCHVEGAGVVGLDTVTQYPG
ncbi:hypothetical protein N656DRAFT_304222 [Canariomyces notabilis]|uniref:Uncharacterized protein n=1 Tax=Canariomyces notabilis TaxID=2074819 RepID=A0AAN6QH77_9PEZI|nr:hypothetical protein N656DRAFT_304222 [Canariomyces arenarius]